MRGNKKNFYTEDIYQQLKKLSEEYLYIFEESPFFLILTTKEMIFKLKNTYFFMQIILIKLLNLIFPCWFLDFRMQIAHFI